MEHLRKLVGATNGSEEGSLRNKYGVEISEIGEGVKIMKNKIHCSGSFVEVAREILILVGIEAISNQSLVGSLVSLATDSKLNNLIENISDGVIHKEEHLKIIKLLLEVNQGHLFAKWDRPGVNDDKKTEFLEQAINFNLRYPGGIAAYQKNARELLQLSSAGENPFEGYKAEIPSGIDVNDIDGKFMDAEEIGLRIFNKSCVVLVAGGLGERLGYNGIKVAIPFSLVNGQTYLDWYIHNIIALQEKSNRLNNTHDRVPFVIMTSDETHELTVALLLSMGFTLTKNDRGYYRFSRKDIDIDIVKQGGVPALVNNNADFCLEDGTNYKLQLKPHGHGDVHMLLSLYGLVDKWVSEGRTHTVFIQDTNGQSFNGILVGLGASVKNDLRLIFLQSLASPEKQ